MNRNFNFGIFYERLANNIKLANGVGNISKLSGKRRNPYRVRKTAGWTEDGKQLFINIGYYKTRKDAMAALMAYNADPYDVVATKSSFADVFQLWLKDRGKHLSDKNKSAYTSAYMHCSSLHDKTFTDIRKPHMQDIIDNCGLGHSVRSKIRTLLKQMYEVAIDLDVVNKNYAQNIDVGSAATEHDKMPFSDAEIAHLWAMSDTDNFAKKVLILIYTGLRVSEFLELETKNIFIDQRYMIGGKKTEAGTDRIIPINEKIIPFIKELYDINNVTLITNKKGNQLSYNTFFAHYKDYMIVHDMRHTIHETRHTTATLLHSAGVDEINIRAILGHSQVGVTAKTYIHDNVENLVKCINMI